MNYINSDVVPFVARDIVSCKKPELEPEERMLFEPYADQQTRGEKPLNINGWSRRVNSGAVPFERLGKRLRLLPDAAYSKGTQVVYYINEAGSDEDVEVALVADTREALDAFIADVIVPLVTLLDTPAVTQDDSAHQSVW